MFGCRLCDIGDIQDLYSLGGLPLGYPMEKNVNPWTADLGLERCSRCGNVQTAITIPESVLETENKYLSETSRIVRKHNQTLSNQIPDILSLDEDAVIWEIGYGDGSLLDHFYDSGYTNLCGIEPVPHSSEKYRFDLVEEFFSKRVTSQLPSDKLKPEVIIANYVIELIPEIRDFFRDLSEVMNKETTTIIEVPYLLDFITKRRIDGFAHLRCNWFTVEWFVNNLSMFGLQIDQLNHLSEYRGGTLQLFISHGSSDSPPENVTRLLKKEQQKLTDEFFNDFTEQMKGIRSAIRSKILDWPEDQIYTYGAGLKASTLLNWLNLASQEVYKAVDQDANKQGLEIPRAGISIHPVEELLNSEEPVIVLILALDHIDEINDLLKENLPSQSRVVNPLPEPTVEDVL